MVGQIIETTIETIAAGGFGVGHINERPVFIAFTAPGDIVKARITENRGTFLKAELDSIVVASKYRVEALCPHYGECGGCSLQHLDMTSQTNAKIKITQELCRRIGAFDAPAITLFPSPSYAYRNRMRFHRVRRRNEWLVGLKRWHSDELLRVSDCPIADTRIQQALRSGDLETANTAERLNVFSFPPLFLMEGTRERGSITISGKQITVDIHCFFQSNVTVLETLIEQLMYAANNAPKKNRALDLYGGVGTFSLFLADLFDAIDIVERERRAISVARSVLGARAAYYAINDTEWTKLPESRAAYDFIVADPPRGGLSTHILDWLACIRPPMFAYVSCNAATFSRDAGELLRKGFKLSSLALFDFYPQTAHTETLAIFQT